MLEYVKSVKLPMSGAGRARLINHWRWSVKIDKKVMFGGTGQYRVRKLLPSLLSHLRAYGRARDVMTPAIDFKELLANKEQHARNATNRRVLANLDHISSLYSEFRALTSKVQAINQARKRLASEFARARSDLGQTLSIMDDVQEVREQGEALNARLRTITEELYWQAVQLPNSTHPSSPIGDSSCNQIVRTFGPPPPPAAVNPHPDHVEVTHRLGIVDFEAGARTSGSAFYFLKGQGALLELALVQYALRQAMAAGFEPILPPDIVWSRLVGACGFWPRSQEGATAYRIEPDGPEKGQDDLPDTDPASSPGSPGKTLAATGEIPLAAYYTGQTLEAAQLPRKWVALSHCFRPETGHHGADSRGLYRVHQFTKVELFILKDGEGDSSEMALQEILSLQQAILTPLGLSCRLLNMASEELGASAHQKYDIEAYFPGRGGWGELTSASNCTDYQSRRLGLRYRTAEGTLRYAHTLNGTACAVPRVIQAIVENHMQADGSIIIPSVLHPFMLDGSTHIAAAK